jgi:hypothetical protein
MSYVYLRKGAGIRRAHRSWRKTSSLLGDEASAAAIRSAFQQGGYEVDCEMRDLKKSSATPDVSPVDFAQATPGLANRRKPSLPLKKVLDSKPPARFGFKTIRRLPSAIR